MARTIGRSPTRISDRQALSNGRWLGFPSGVLGLSKQYVAHNRTARRYAEKLKKKNEKENTNDIRPYL